MRDDQKKRIRGYFSKRSQCEAILFNTPIFLFVSLITMSALWFRFPKRKNYVYPIKIDVQRITGYY